MTAAALVEVPEHVLDEMWQADTFEPCRVYPSDGKRCSNRAAWLAHCSCSHCGGFRRPVCHHHHQLILRATDLTITHTADRGSAKIERFTPLSSAASLFISGGKAASS